FVSPQRPIRVTQVGTRTGVTRICLHIQFIYFCRLDQVSSCDQVIVALDVETLTLGDVFPQVIRSLGGLQSLLGFAKPAIRTRERAIRHCKIRVELDSTLKERNGCAVSLLAPGLCAQTVRFQSIER